MFIRSVIRKNKTDYLSILDIFNEFTCKIHIILCKFDYYLLIKKVDSKKSPFYDFAISHNLATILNDNYT